jgi:arsenate reductase
MPYTIYHNPRCSKSRQALELMRKSGIQPAVIDYLKSPPDEIMLGILCTSLGGDPRVMVRFDEAEAKALALSENDKRPRREWLQLLAERPKLIQRPIVTGIGKAVIARPPEKVLELL